MRAAAGLSALSPLMALGNPTGGQVVGGSATISTPSANGTVIRQASQNAAINWQQFSVGADQYVQFVQPSSSAVVLNRVIGGNPSSIFGNITANGQVFLVNPNGILFAPGASLDVAGLVASTQDLSAADFMAGRHHFSKAAGAPDATVVNRGALSASGGYVVLAGDYVENDGHIDAQSGRVLLAAGGSTTLSFDKNQLISYAVNGATLARLAGVSNTGQITANGGAVVMTADVGNALIATAVNNSGFIAAHSIKSAGGVIELLAEGGTLSNSGTLDVSATDAGVAGGTVLLRGNGHTQLEPTSVIDAGGDDASGGFVELSGHHLAVRGTMDLGHGGNLLLDPAKLFITAGSSKGGSITSGDFVGEHFIDAQLNAGVNVVLVASTSIASGNPGGVASGPATAITATTGAGNLTLKTGTLTLHSGTAGHGSLMNMGAASLAHCGQGVCKPYGSAATVSEIFAATSGTIKLTGVTINIKGALAINAQQGTVTLGAVTANGVSVTAGTVNLNGSVNAGAGKLSIAANHGPPTAAVITVASGKTLSGKSVSLTASGSYGGKISAGAVTATGGSVTLSAKDPSANNGSAVISAGNLTGRAVDLLATGRNRKITTGAVTANGATSTASVHDYAKLSLASSAAALAGITVGGPIKSSHGSVSIAARTGTLTVTGAGSAGKNIKLSATTINVGALTAASAVSLTGIQNAAKPTTLTASGLLKGQSVKATVNLTVNATQSGSIHLAGGASATGLGVGSITVTASAAAAVKTKIVTGALKTALRQVALTQKGGAGSVSVAGPISAGASIGVRITTTDTGLGGNVTLGGNVKGAGINLSATGKGGGDIAVTGSLDATTGPNGVRLSAKAGPTLAGGNVTVSGPITAPHGAINIQTSGGGASGGRINVGALSAGRGTSAVTINASYHGTAAGFLAKTGAITTKGFVRVSMTGKAPHFSAAGLSGAPSVCECGPNVVNVTLHPSVASGSSGKINIAGPVFAGQSSLTLNASHGSVIITGPVTDSHLPAKPSGLLTITGSVINVGAISVPSGDATLIGEKAAHATTITTGAISAHKIAVTLPSTANSGAINIGAASATGIVAAHEGITLTATTTAAKKMQITAGGLKAAGGAITVKQGGASGNVNLGGSISAAGALSISAHDTVAAQTSISVTGNIKAGSVKLQASGANAGKITAGNITANGAATGIPNHSVGGSIVAEALQVLPVNTERGIVTLGDLAATGRISVFGTTISVGGVNAGGQMFLSAQGTAGRHATVTASKAIVFGAFGSIEARGPSGAIHVGKVTATNSGVSFFALGSAGHPGLIVAGDVTAKHYVAFSASAAAGRAGTVSVGTVKASNSYVSMSAGKITTTGPVTAASNVSFRGLQQLNIGGAVTASGYLLIKGSQIDVAGPVTAGSQFGVTLPGHTKAVSSGYVKLIANAVTGAASINVAGNVSGRSATFSAHGATDAAIAAGTITAHKVKIVMQDTTSAKGGQLKVGAVNATGTGALASSGQINIAAKFAGQPANVTAGNLTATRAIGVHVSDGSGGLTLGNVAAPKAVVSLTAGNVKVGSLATGANSGAVSAAGSLTVAVTGNMTLSQESLKAGKSVHLQAGGNLSLSNLKITGSAFSAAAGGNLADSAAGSLNLAAATLKAGKALDLKAGGDIALGKANINAGSFQAKAGGNIADGGGTGAITAAALAMTAGGSIGLAHTQLTIGTANPSGIKSDAVLQGVLAANGLAPATPLPNGYFNAGTSLTLGGLTMTGDYLYVQAGSVAFTGPVKLPAKSLVQVAPATPTLPIHIEDTTLSAGAAVRSFVTHGTGPNSFGLTNRSFLSLFPGDTIVVGNSTEAGDVTIGGNGKITLSPGTNVVVYTTGTVTGLELLVGSGLVNSLQTLLAGTTPVVVTSAEVDPTADSTKTGLGDQTDKKKLGQSDATGGASQPGGTIVNDNGDSGVCH